MLNKSTYDINKINKNSFIAYTHLGLGDHIVCNGFLNHFSKSFEKIFLPVKSRDFENISYLYSQNKKIELFKIEHETEVKDIHNFSKKNNLKILKIGFKKRKPPFNKSFYDQLQLPYEISINEFKYKRDVQKENKLFEHLKKIYNVSDDYQLVHNQSSYGKVNLKLNSNLSVIFVEKETDIFKNIFYYTKVIQSAKEIHCLDSSILHLVERIDTDAILNFHNIKKAGQKGAEVYLIKNWKEVNY